MKRQPFHLAIAAACALASAPASADAGGAMRVSQAIWVNGELYGTVLTPTSFAAPPAQSLDLLYNFSMSGLAGQRSVAESAPGDPTYNGGRWWVQMVVFTAAGIAALDKDGDGLIEAELTSATEVMRHVSLGHLVVVPTSTYFECPLLPHPTAA
jgi:hypothetical protein